jgi:hypothetical protein
MLGLNEWWDRRYYSCTILVPENVMKRAQGVRERVKRDDINTMGLLRHKWGEGVLDNNEKYPKLFEDLEEWYGVDFHESIITWHIATDLILAAWEKRDKGHYAEYHEDLDRVDTVRALSNYMMFLLVNRPYMLPGLPQNWLYKKTCDNLDMLYIGKKLRYCLDQLTFFFSFSRRPAMACMTYVLIYLVNMHVQKRRAGPIQPVRALTHACMHVLFDPTTS